MAGMKTVHKWVCGLLLLAFISSAVAQTPCTQDDYIGEYSQCTFSGTHDLFWYKDPASNCSGGVDLPAPVFRLPCNITCAPGQFLKLGDTACTACSPGTYSDGASTIVDEWHNFPTNLGQMTTWCQESSLPPVVSTACGGWKPNSAVVMSGNITANQASVLQLTTYLQADGVLRFQYRLDLIRVPSSYSDEFNFYLDGDLVFGVSAGEDQATTPFLDYSISLTAGFHVIQWQYIKQRQLFKRDMDSAEVQHEKRIGLPIHGGGPAIPPNTAAFTDGAFISAIEISGLEYADTECTACPQGFHSAASGASSCDPCSEGSIAASSGEANCDACPSGKYSWKGQTNCLFMLPCQDKDYNILHPTCTGTTAAATVAPLQPQICDPTSFTPPTAAPIPCSDLCPPGSTLSGTTCTFCPNGTVSSGGSSACQPCPAGNVAVRYLEAVTWHSLPSYAQTSCTGTCGTNGWRVRGNFIDSGAGHLVGAQSVYEMDITLDYPGDITVVYSLNCSGTCSLAFHDITATSTTESQTMTSSPQDPFTGTTSFTNSYNAGARKIQLVFLIRDSATPWSDFAAVYSVNISNVNAALGGAATCQPCPDGTFSQVGAHECTKCPAGSLGETTHTTCNQCTDNSWTTNPLMGTPVAECVQCGPGTTATADTSDCNNTCKFNTDGNDYDLNPLDAALHILGPYKDAAKNSYWIDLCGRSLPQCGSGRQTHVCRQDQFDVTVNDLGFMPGYFGLDDGSLGFRVNYDYGDVQGSGCSTDSGRYNTDVTFICDPKSVFRMVQNFTESPSCHFNVQFASMYACPLCTADDFIGEYSQCTTNGIHDLLWVKKPTSNCTGGVSLPAPVLGLACNITCNPGEFLPLGASACQACSPGTYSDGASTIVDEWFNFPTSLGTMTTWCESGFPASPTSACQAWRPNSAVAMSGIDLTAGQASILQLTTFLTTDGNLRFTYRVDLNDDAGDEMFQFFLDGDLLLEEEERTTPFEQFGTNLSAGWHVMQWKYSIEGFAKRSVTERFGIPIGVGPVRPPPIASLNNGVFISVIEISGIEYADTECAQCPEGYHSSLSTASTCDPCAMNTFAGDTGMADCSACKTGQFAWQGQPYCTDMFQCEDEDYVALYPSCNSHTTASASAVVSLLQPSICDPTGFTPTTPAAKQCSDLCPPGSTWSAASSSCTFCAAGTFSAGQTAPCQACGAGHFSVRYLEATNWHTLPNFATTHCVGPCGSNGWRLRGDHIDSGAGHLIGAFSVLEITVDLEFAGDLFVTYAFNCTGTCTFIVQEVLPNGQTDEIISEESSRDNPTTGMQEYDTIGGFEDETPFAAGSHTFQFVSTIQDSPSSWTDTISIYSIRVSNVVASLGGASKCEECANGTTAAAGANACTACPSGTVWEPTHTTCTRCTGDTWANNPLIADAPNECLPCGFGTVGTDGSDCNDTCKFNVNGVEFDLNPLDAALHVLGPYPDGAFGVYRTYIDLCGRTQTACQRQTHVCHEDEWGVYSTDIGNMPSYFPLDDGSQGFRINFDYGDVQDPYSNCSTPSGRYNTDVIFTCDPNTVLNLTKGTVQDPPCHYTIQFASLYACAMCTLDDYISEYTECSVSGTRDLVWFKNPQANCTGGPALPLPTTNIPCNLTCPPGEFLPHGSKQCKTCDPGTYSDGASTIVNEWFNFPTSLGTMTTWCQDGEIDPVLSTCGAWKPDPTASVLMSGTGLANQQWSILQLTTYIMAPGTLRFQYRLDLVADSAAHTSDQFEFTLDGISLTSASAPLTTPFLEFATNLTVGFHTLQWRFGEDYRFFLRDEIEEQSEYAKRIGIIGGPGPARPPPTASLVDGVFISAIEISGIENADTECTACPEGYHASGSGASTCDPCEMNTIANQPGLATCTACRSDQYSWKGASYCTDMFECDSDDYQTLYPSCSGANAVGQVAYLQPQICDPTGVSLPTAPTRPCSDFCAPGSSWTGSSCSFCPTGQASVGGTAPCATCPAGTVAVRNLNIVNWHSLPNNAQTSCNGTCGTNGWRMRGTFMDSGAGHLVGDFSIFEITVDLEFPGQIAFGYQLNCAGTCTISFNEIVGTSIAELISDEASPAEPETGMLSYASPISTPGSHTYQITFTVQDSPTPWTDLAYIYSINVSNVVASQGGASVCQPCPDGTYSTAGSQSCTPCPAGSLGESTHSRCNTCPGNSWTTNSVQKTPVDSCEPCGAGITATADTSDCINNCQFTLGSESYDINPLSAVLPILGPFSFSSEPWETDNFFINMCGRSQPNCVGVDTHVCKIDNFGGIVDAGFQPSYLPLDGFGGVGFRLNYDWGDQQEQYNCNTTSGRYNTDINFICEPDTIFSTGRPVYEEPSCHYNFQFFSKYACPVCTAIDYDSYFTPCQNGQHRQIFYWKEPRVRHDGVPLPAAQTVSCTSNNGLSCANNQKISPPSFPVAQCVNCPNGTYSIATGLLISNWTESAPQLPTNFASFCNAPPCTLWSSDDSVSVHAGVGDSSMVATYTFAQAGSVGFSYKVYAPTTGMFRFYIDEVLKLTVKNAVLLTCSHESYPVTVGPHTFRWEFSGGLLSSPTLLQYQGITMTNLLLQGLGAHADSCTPCPPGTRTANATEINQGTLGCVTCPSNFYSPGESDTCDYCGDEYWSLPGSATCTLRHQCTVADYQIVNGACQASSNTRTSSYALIPPSSCFSFDPYTPPTLAPVACAPCPAGTARNPTTGACDGCARGTFFNSASGKCENNVPGTIVQYSIGYFVDDTITTLPSEFFTECTGLCGTNGWRIRGATIDSGYHGSNAVDSFLQLTSTVNIAGSISFKYFLNSTAPEDGLIFLVDDAVVGLPMSLNGFTTVSVPVQPGYHTFKWNYHQELGAGLVTVSNIVVNGASNGGSTVLVQCPAGSASASPTDTACTLCQPGYFAPQNGTPSCSACDAGSYAFNAGATSCTPCEAGSYASTGASICNANCTVAVGGTVYTIPEEIVTIANPGTAFTFSVCSLATPSCQNSHVCSNSLSLGRTFELVPNAGNSSAQQPFSIVFGHGDSENCTNGAERTSTIAFTCNPTAGQSSSPIFTSQAGCDYYFTWETSFACRACTDADYQEVQGTCSSGKRQISRTRIGNCNGPASQSVVSKSCNTKDVPVGAIAGVSAALGVVLVGAAVVLVRNRILAKQYDQLLDNKSHTTGSRM